MIHTLGWNWFGHSHQMTPSHQMTIQPRNKICKTKNLLPLFPNLSRKPKPTQKPTLLPSFISNVFSLEFNKLIRSRKSFIIHFY